MKVDPECIRDILSAIESIVDDANLTVTFFCIEDFQETDASLEKYLPNVVSYHCQQICLSGYLYNGKILPEGGISFMDLSPKGHELLSQLRTPKLLEAVKKFAQTTGTVGIQQIATFATDEFLRLLPDVLKL